MALTPDASQVAHVRDRHPDVAVEHCKFEELDAGKYEGAFGTVINSESLQYMNLEPNFKFFFKSVHTIHKKSNFCSLNTRFF